MLKKIERPPFQMALFLKDEAVGGFHGVFCSG